MIEGADLPDLAVTWVDRDGSVIDFSSYSFAVKIGAEAGGAALFTKTSGVTGAGTAPNIVVAWLPSEIGSLTAGRYVIEITAVAVDTRERRKQISLDVTRRLT